MRVPLIRLILASAIPLPVWAADLTVTVKGNDGMPLADAVVVVKPLGAGPAPPVKFSWPLVMSQQNIAFTPYVLIVPVGSEVAFPNKDKVRHHVYSFSAAKKFELKLYGQQAERSVVFDKAGVVALGCNIHDQMIGFIYVTDSPYAAKTDADGEAVIHGLPGGAATMSVWHPEMKARTPLVKPAPSGHDTIVLEMRPMSVRHQH